MATHAKSLPATLAHLAWVLGWAAIGPAIVYFVAGRGKSAFVEAHARAALRRDVRFLAVMLALGLVLAVALGFILTSGALPEDRNHQVLFVVLPVGLLGLPFYVRFLAKSVTDARADWRGELPPSAAKAG